MSGKLGKYKYHLVIVGFLAVMVTLLGTQMNGEEQVESVIIPQPNVLKNSDGSIDFSGISDVVANGHLSEGYKSQVFKFLADYVVKEHSEGVVLYLADDESMDKEQYRLDIKEEGVFIVANTIKGFFYGIQSLNQLITIHQKALPVLTIDDNPRFSWRGLHLDVSRHFFGVEKIKEILDWMAFYKLNHFHWHLVDDQGWRIEIENYPRLTSVGGIRTETEGSTYGPYFYTQEQIKDVVKYAAERHIEVVPEIELPGHSTAAIAAYPWLSCLKKELEVGNTWGVYEDVYCAGDEAVFEFMENVLKEVFELFPSHYVHIGADECPKSRWEQCPKCQERIKKEGLSDEYELQAYFVERIADFLKENGKALIGWDEILQGYLADDAVVMSWHGIECGEIAARGGNPAIMTPRDILYFNKYQGCSEVEPLALGGYSTLKNVYDCEPMPEGLSSAEEELVLGVQGNLWTEHISKETELDYMLMPRMLALSEIAWTGKEQKSWTDFQKRMLLHYPILDNKGVNYHVALPEGVSENEVIIGNEKLSFRTTDPNVELYIQKEGKKPELFNGKYKAASSEQFTVYSQLPNGRQSKLRHINISKMEPLPAVVPEDVKGPGLRCQWTKTSFTTETEFNDLVWENSIKEKEPENARKYLRNNENGMIKLNAYLKVPKTGVYEFEGHPDWLHIDGYEVMDNSKKSKRIIYRGQVALDKGWHKIEAVFLIREFLAMPVGKIKTELLWRQKHKDWESIKPYCFVPGKTS